MSGPLEVEISYVRERARELFFRTPHSREAKELLRLLALLVLINWLVDEQG